MCRTHIRSSTENRKNICILVLSSVRRYLSKAGRLQTNAMPNYHQKLKEIEQKSILLTRLHLLISVSMYLAYE